MRKTGDSLLTHNTHVNKGGKMLSDNDGNNLTFNTHIIVTGYILGEPYLSVRRALVKSNMYISSDFFCVL